MPYCVYTMRNREQGDNKNGGKVMKVTFAKSELTNNSDAVKAIVTMMSDAKHGGFMRVNGFQSKGGHGEIQNTTYCKGISYENAVKNSLALLEEIESNANLDVTVTRGVWKDADGNISPTNRKNKVYTLADTVTETYGYNSPEVQEALVKVRNGLENPRPSKEYTKLGNGVYVDETSDTIYLRDLRVVSKVVVSKGDYPFTASGAVTAIKSAIEKDMPIGKYRMFRLDADFTSISLGGIELSNGTMSGSTPQDKTAQATATAQAVTTN